MTNPWDFDNDEEEESFEKPKRGRGRPKGASTKTMTQRLILEQFEDLYGRVEKMLTPDQQRYYKEAFSGKKAFDPLKDAELFARLYSVYCIVITTEALATKSPKKEVAENVNQYRQFIKDIEEMARKREELKEKRGEGKTVVDPTRESTLDIFESLHR